MYITEGDGWTWVDTVIVVLQWFCRGGCGIWICRTFILGSHLVKSRNSTKKHKNECIFNFLRQKFAYLKKKQ